MVDWREIYDFWFPTGLDADHATHRAQIQCWFGGGADAGIVARYGEILDAAIRGDLAAWKSSPRGMLALIIVLDQFPRSIHQGTPRAFAHDGEAVKLAQEGIANGSYDALDAVWEKMFFSIPLVHAEGPDHVARIDRAVELTDPLAREAPAHLRQLYEFAAQQPRAHREVIGRFGRFPHRNDILGRVSTAEEQQYLETEVPVHRRKPPE